MEDLFAHEGPGMILHLLGAVWALQSAVKVFCHEGGYCETKMLSRHCTQCDRITSKARGDTTTYQSFPGYLLPVFPSQGLWGQGRQWECVGWPGRRQRPHAPAPNGALSYALNLTASQLEHPKKAIMLHYPLPKAF